MIAKQSAFNNNSNLMAYEGNNMSKIKELLKSYQQKKLSRHSTNFECLLELPSNLLIDQIIQYLDIKSILALQNSNKQIKHFFHQQQDLIYKKLLFRDQIFMIATEPIHKLKYPIYKSDIQIIYDTPEEAKAEYEDIAKLPFMQLLQQYYQSEHQKNFIEKPFELSQDVQKLIPYYKTYIQKVPHIVNYKQEYLQNSQYPNYSGVYVGDYQSHGLELIYIFQYGYELYAVKMTGDPNVPENKVTWKMRLSEDMKTGKGFIRLAEQGFQNSKWSTAYLEVEEDMMIIKWYYEFNGLYYQIIYANKRADKQVLENFDVNKLIQKRKIEQIQLIDKSIEDDMIEIEYPNEQNEQIDIEDNNSNRTRSSSPYQN